MTPEEKRSQNKAKIQCILRRRMTDELAMQSADKILDEIASEDRYRSVVKSMVVPTISKSDYTIRLHFNTPEEADQAFYALEQLYYLDD